MEGQAAMAKRAQARRNSSKRWGMGRAAEPNADGRPRWHPATEEAK